MPAVDKVDEDSSQVRESAASASAKFLKRAFKEESVEPPVGGKFKPAPLTIDVCVPRSVLVENFDETLAKVLAEKNAAVGIQSDKGLLDTLNFSEHEAATILGRTRQSLYQAGLSKRTNYFKTNDLRSLVFEAKGRNRDLDLSPVLDYLRETRGEAVAEAIRAVSAHDAGRANMSGYADLWIVLPDVAWLNRSHPDSMKQVVRFGAENLNARYFTASTMDRDLLKAALRSAGVAEPRVTAQDWMGAIPPLIIGDPQTRADIYLFNNGQFTSNDWYGGSKLVMLIQNLVDERMKMTSDPVAMPEGRGQPG